MFRLALRTALAYRVRLLLTAVAAVLGVAFVSGTLMLTSALDRTFTEIITGTATDLQITARSAIAGDAPAGPDGVASAGLVPDSVVQAVLEVPGVADAAGVATGPGVALLDAEGDVLGGQGPPALGLTWLSNPDLSNATITAGREPRSSGEIVVDELTGERLGLPLGSAVDVVTADQRLATTLVGYFRLGTAGGQAGLTLTAFVPEQAQQLLTAPGEWTLAVASVESGASTADVAQAVSASIGPDFEVQTREQQVDAAVSALREGLGFVTTIIGVFAGIALFVAGFLIYNTFAMLIAQRGRELALLRAVGALRRQVLSSVLVEALLVAAVSAVLGVAAGYLLAVVLKALLGVIGLQLNAGIALTGRSVVWAGLLAVVVTCVSALVPAVRASRTAPMAALRDAGRPAESVGRVRTLLGALLAAWAGWRISQSLSGELGAEQTAWAAAALLLAAILLAPALARVFSLALTRLLGLIAGVPGRIAGRSAARAPKRVAATASALMIGLALVSGVSVIVASAQQSLADLVDRTFVGDLLVTRDGRGFSPDVAAAVAEVDGVGVVVQQTGGPAQLGDRQLQLDALGLTGTLPALELALGGASPQDVAAGQAVVSQSASGAYGLTIGDTADLLLPSGEVLTVAIALVVEDNPLVGDIVVPLEDYRAAGGETRDRAVFVVFDGSQPREQVDEAVREVVAVNPLLSVFSQTELKERSQEQLNQLLYLVYALLGLSIVIAALGVVNTMALSVVERTREIGLIRAVGASRRQVRRMIRWEAVLVSTLGGILGLGIGVLVGVALRSSLADDGLEVLAIPWGSLAWIFAAAVVIGVVGAVLPARRASRLNILEAIGAE